MDSMYFDFAHNFVSKTFGVFLLICKCAELGPLTPATSFSLQIHFNDLRGLTVV